MFKRILWLVIGAGLGFGASFWLMRFARATIERYRPERVSSDVSDALGGFGRHVRTAVVEGRAAMRERESELRTDLSER